MKYSKKELEPKFRQYYLDITQRVASLSTCKRANVGAVIVKDNKIISTGYNGSVRGTEHCTDVGCLMVDNHCMRCLHAEVNAIAFAEKDDLKRATLFCTHKPCLSCFNLLAQVGITDVVYLNDYGKHEGEVAEYYYKVKRARGISFHKGDTDYY